MRSEWAWFLAICTGTPDSEQQHHHGEEGNHLQPIRKDLTHQIHRIARRLASIEGRSGSKRLQLTHQGRGGKKRI